MTDRLAEGCGSEDASAIHAGANEVESPHPAHGAHGVLRLARLKTLRPRLAKAEAPRRIRRLKGSESLPATPEPSATARPAGVSRHG